MLTELTSDAIRRQARRLDYSPAFNFGHHGVFELARVLADQFRGDLDHAFFTNSGSEAVDTALKMALAYHRHRGEGSRTRLIGRVGGYHGVGFGGISAGGMPSNRKMFGGLLTGVDHLPFPHGAKSAAHTRGQSCADPMTFLAELESLVTLHDASKIAAVIVEGFSGWAGVFIPPGGYLETLRVITRRHGILLILDEVITVFGRLGAPNASSYFGGTPDMCTIAKGINNATVPMGATVVSHEIHRTFMEATSSGVKLFHGYTCSAHPLAVASALANQEVLAREGIYAQMAELAPYFEDAVHSLRGERHVTDIRNIGLAAGLRLAPGTGAPGPRGYDVFMATFEAGVAIRNNGDTLALAPIMTSSRQDIDRIVEALRQGLRRAG